MGPQVKKDGVFSRLAQLDLTATRSGVTRGGYTTDSLPAEPAVATGPASEVPAGGPLA